ncbi:MAG: histidine--tRNA ligase [Gammaproteobacteria bacterium]|nr:histidine--tRNA ligase [Gammaproteobacteria bacterium]MBU0786493.1 histidine--tRNA ligase [Gammaproteobacteria bacterium]MBU0816196.1 histidine--tRNA ligase [Gammaproteobacteria bacterium]MBU1787778.1 histidine--tRNA ligase [Gammaproteobacteria bacterium]
MEKLLAVKGMNDILPPESTRWEWLEEKVRDLMLRHAYRNIRTPIVEPTALFVRGTGETTDIVEKEMYSFEDRLNGEALTLRPENTPGVVRAAIEHNLTYDGGKRLYYMGPMFRHERPQRGRYRQFYQLGAEALGFNGPELDAELMLLAHQLFADLGLRNIRVELNSLGIASERHAHRAALIAYLEKHAEVLDADAQRRLHTNPLRILDTKNPAMQAMVQEAPRLLSYLGEASLKHFDTVKTLLSACGVPWKINPRLVRGLDYYSHTVFEFITDELGAQGTLCGGGRYDGLFELLGGKPTAAVGWGMGVERVLELLKEQGQFNAGAELDAYAIVPDAEALPVVMQCLQTLRASGVSVQMHAGTGDGMGSMKSQFKRADASGARHALIFGADELAQNVVTVKSLRDGSGLQRSMPLGDAARWATDLQSKT